jgi:hypothetical protein
MTYLLALAWVMAMVTLTDIAHFLELIYPSAIWKDSITEEQAEHIWPIVKKHILLVVTLSMLSYMVSLTVISISFPLQLGSNPILGIAIFTSAALLLIAALALEK